MDISKILDVSVEPTDKLEHLLKDATDYTNPENDYTIPCPMADFQKELTDAIVSLHYSDILKYFETTTKNDLLLIDSLQKLYLNIQLISTHPYLLIDHFMPKSLTAKDIPEKLIQTSGKFKVLRMILDIVCGIQIFRRSLKAELVIEQGKLVNSNNNQHNGSGHGNSSANFPKKKNQAIFNTVKSKLIGLIETLNSKNYLLIARQGRTIDLLESLLLGLKVSYVRYSGNNVKNSSSRSKNANNNPDAEHGNGKGSKNADPFVLQGEDAKEYIKKRINSYPVNLSSNLENYANHSTNLNSYPIYPVTIHIISSDDLMDYNNNPDLYNDKDDTDASKQKVKLFFKLFDNSAFKFDLMIPFDISMDLSCEVIQQLRSINYVRTSCAVDKAPILRLIPIYTVDHIATNFSCSPKDFANINETFRNTVSAIVVERGQVGLLDSNMKTIINNNLDFIENWLLYFTDKKFNKKSNVTGKENDGKNSCIWPIPPIPIIPIYEPQDVEKSLLKEVNYTPEDDYSDIEEEKKNGKDAEDNSTYDDFNPNMDTIIKVDKSNGYSVDSNNSKENISNLAYGVRKRKVKLNFDPRLEFENLPLFKKLYFKTNNDYFYDSKRLSGNYILNPVQLNNRSSIIGIETDSVMTHSSYRDYIIEQLILTHFEMYEINVKYLKFNNIERDLEISKKLSEEHLEDFRNSLNEFDKFLAKNDEIVKKQSQLEKYIDFLKQITAEKEKNKVCLNKQFEMLLHGEKRERNDLSVSVSVEQGPDGDAAVENDVLENEMKIIDLIRQKGEASKLLELKNNELTYLNVELEKLDKIRAENTTIIATKSEKIDKLIEKIKETMQEYDNIEGTKKKRRLNEMVSEVDGLALEIRSEITNYENSGYGKNRNKYRRK